MCLSMTCRDTHIYISMSVQQCQPLHSLKAVHTGLHCSNLLVSIVLLVDDRIKKVSKYIIALLIASYTADCIIRVINT